MYVAARTLNCIIVLENGSSNVINTISSNFDLPNSIFVTKNGDLYVDNGQMYGCVDLWRPNSTSSILTMKVNKTCYSLFIDTNDDLYCSTDDGHRVIKRILTDKSFNSTTVAGNGSAGSLPWMLNQPRGIFVDHDFSLYVADCSNDRIQFFLSGKRNGTTLVDNRTITLNCPSGVVLDADGLLYIVDGDHHRILTVGPNGYRCILGCPGLPGTAMNRLDGPRSISFDSYGNIYVIDRKNSRLQKFLIIPTSCGNVYRCNCVIEFYQN